VEVIIIQAETLSSKVCIKQTKRHSGHKQKKVKNDTAAINSKKCTKELISQ
jgi:hypothetical protein